MSMRHDPPATRRRAVPTRATATAPSVSLCCELQLGQSERLASLGILAAGVAHEIRNPLASVLAGVEALRRRIVRTSGGLPPEVAAEAERILDILERETSRVRDITDKLMLLARPDPEVPAWVDVNRSVEDTLALLRYQMNVQGIALNLDLQRDLQPIRARAGGVRGLCMNLAMNAVQAMPEGGSLTVRTRGRGEEVLIEVEDTGPGISVEHMSRIWDPFFTTKPRGKGTGLGLPISQTIVEQHGGSIQVQNTVPHGALFTVTLPTGRR